MSGQIPTPPATESKSSSSRRRALNSSEESQTVPSVAIDTTDFYRSGAPNSLPALPLQSQPVDADSRIYAQFKAIRPSIFAALNGISIGFTVVHLLHRFVRGESPTQNDLTIVISTERDEQRDNLTLIVNDVLNILFKANIRNIRVEAIDTRAHQRYFVPTPTPLLTARWSLLKQRIVAILGKTNNSWSSLLVLNRGHQESTSKTVIIIGARPEAVLEWKDQVRSKILDLLESVKLNMDVVFVREAFAAAGVDQPLLRPLQDFRGPVSIGNSIEMEDNSGTLGGYFTFENQKGQKKVFGVTNHHVVFSDDTIKEAEKVGKSGLELLGVKKFGEFPWKVQSPSLADKEARLSYFDRSIRGFTNTLDGHDIENKETGQKSHIDGLNEKLQRATWKGGDTTGLQGKIHRNEQSRAGEIRERTQLQNTTDLEFAKVFATSGRAQYGKQRDDGSYHAMDWALLDCRSDRVGDSTFPVSEKFKSVRSNWPAAVEEATKFSGVSNANENDYYAYTRSGHKVGQFSKCDALNNLDDSGLIYHTLVFVNNEDGFMRQGDSGCWILNRSGQLEALGWAASPELFIGYAIPIETVYEDMQNRVGFKIVDPPLVNY